MLCMTTTMKTINITQIKHNTYLFFLCYIHITTAHFFTDASYCTHILCKYVIEAYYDRSLQMSIGPMGLCLDIWIQFFVMWRNKIFHELMLFKTLINVAIDSAIWYTTILTFILLRLIELCWNVNKMKMKAFIYKKLV